MTPEEVEAHYREAIAEAGEQRVKVRRYYGVTRTFFEAKVPAKIARYGKEDLIGNAQQGDVNVILLASDLKAARFPLPLISGDTVTVEDKELHVVAPDAATRRVAGVLIAYDLVVRGVSL